MAGEVVDEGEGVEMKKVVTFGEIMLRLSPPGFLRFEQAASLDVQFGGGEANVAVSLARFGVPTEYVTRLPRNEIADAGVDFLRRHGVGTSHILRGGERMGIYFLENGAVQRGSKVVYDRAGSSISTIERGMVDWRSVFEGADWFHVTGITPAISRGAAEAAVEAASVAREMGLTVSCDLNYRAKLWKWGRPAGEVMSELVSQADVAIGNEEDAEKVFGIHAAGTDVRSGKLDAERYGEVCRQLTERFPNVKQVGITLRGSISASHNSWSGVLYSGGELYSARSYDITHIVDRVGGGDAFAAGLIYGLRSFDDPRRALEFAVAASCLKHSIVGDLNLVSLDEVEKLMGGDGSGRVSR
jgi:2-dehydro-3-deoxygluconokinase